MKKVSSWRPEGYKSPYHKTADYGQGKMSWNEHPEFSAYEAGYNKCLEDLEPLIRKIAPSSKLIDILYPKQDKKSRIKQGIATRAIVVAVTARNNTG